MRLVVFHSKHTRFQVPGFHLVPLLLLQYPCYSTSIRHVALEAADESDGPHRPCDYLFPPSFIMSCKRSFAFVTALTLRAITLSSHSFLARFIMAFPALQCLEIHGVSFLKEDECLALFPMGRTLSLRTMDVNLDWKGMGILRWLTKHAILLKLGSFTLVFCSHPNDGMHLHTITRTVQKVISQAAASLQYFDSSVCYLTGNGENVDVPMPSFYKNANLLSLSLHIHETTPMQYLADTFIVCRLLTTIHLTSRTHDPARSLSDLDDVVSEGPESLKNITLDYGLKAEWITGGRYALRMKERRKIWDTTLINSKKLSGVLRDRGGKLSVRVKELYNPSAKDHSTSEDEFSDNEDGQTEDEVWQETKDGVELSYIKLHSEHKKLAREIKDKVGRRNGQELEKRGI